MDFQSMRLFFALLALAANAGTIGIVAIGFAGRTTATLGSLYLSDIVHLVPCTYCWYQRIAMYPLVVIFGIAALRKDHGVRIYATALATIGAAIALYHRIVQAFPDLNGSACSSGVPCTAAYFTLFGFVTIPYMALSGFLLILALLYVDRSNSAA